MSTDCRVFAWARSPAPLTLARRVKPYTDPEVKHIGERTAHAPIPITHNDKVINVPAATPPKGTALHYVLLDAEQGSDLVITTLRSAAKRAFYQRVTMVDGQLHGREL